MKYISSLYDILDLKEVGRKAYNLSILLQKGYNVPKGFVIKGNVFDYWLKHIHYHYQQ